MASLMKERRSRASARISGLLDEFSQRLNTRRLFCFPTDPSDRRKLERIHGYCQQHGFIFTQSTIQMIRRSLSTMMVDETHSRTSLDRSAVQTRFQLAHVNGLPNRIEHGLFLVIELGHRHVDVRYTLVSLLGKRIPAYEIVHSKGYMLPKTVRNSRGTVLLDRLAIGLRHFFEEVRCSTTNTS